MRTFVTSALLILLSACSGGSGGSGSDSDAAAKTGTSAAEAVQQTCAEVRAGIDEFNRHDYAATVKHFQKAKAPAKIYAKVNPEPEADALLDAVEYYANLAPEKYAEAARSSENFARNKTITLTQCASDEPADEEPHTQV